MAAVFDLLLDLHQLGVQTTQVVGLDVDFGKDLFAPGLDVGDLPFERGDVLAQLAQLLLGGVARRLRVEEEVGGASRLELLERAHDRAEQLVLSPLADQFGIEGGEPKVQFVEEAADLLDVECVLLELLDVEEVLFDLLDVEEVLFDLLGVEGVFFRWQCGCTHGGGAPLVFTSGSRRKKSCRSRRCCSRA